MFYSSTLKIIPRNLYEIVPSWIRLLYSGNETVIFLTCGGQILYIYGEMCVFTKLKGTVHIVKADYSWLINGLRYIPYKNNYSISACMFKATLNIGHLVFPITAEVNFQRFVFLLYTKKEKSLAVSAKCAPIASVCPHILALYSTVYCTYLITGEVLIPSNKTWLLAVLVSD